MEQDLFLDPSIMRWVLLPITATMILVGVFRHYLMQLFDSPPKPLARNALREQRAITRGVILRTNGNHLPAYEFKARRDQLAQAYEQGIFLKDGPPSTDAGNAKEAAAPPNPLDPANMDTMMGGMKKQMLMFIPQTILMGWINFCVFTGFILIKLPFPLTPRFKQMLQARIDTQDMDVTWVSSLSWYIINLFGLNAVYKLLLGEDNAADGTRDMQAMNNMGAQMMPGMPGQAQDYTKLFNAEKDNLQLITHDWAMEDVEDRVLKMFGFETL